MISSAEWPEGSDMEVEALIACHRSMRKALDRIVQDFVAKWQEQKG